MFGVYRTSEGMGKTISIGAQSFEYIRKNDWFFVGVFTMRTGQKMYDLIINMAKEDERIRAVYRNGLRINVYCITPEFTALHWLNVYGWRYAVKLLGNFNR